MTGQTRARKCCPHCNSLRIHKVLHVYISICQSCGEKIKSSSQLCSCPHCHSFILIPQHVPLYSCYICGSKFDAPSFRNVKSPIGRLPRSLLPKKEVEQ